MQKRIWIATAALVAGLMAVRSRGEMAMPQIVDLPHEAIVGSADLVVTATVTEVGKASPRNGPASMKVVVKKILHNPDKRDLQDKTIIVDCLQPQIGRFSLLTIQPKLPVAGDTVVVALAAESGDAFHLLAWPKAYSVDVDAAEKSWAGADPAKLNWGKTADGVRAVACVESAAIDPQTHQPVIRVVMGMQNMGNVPMVLNISPADGLLTLKALWDETAVAARAKKNAYEPPAASVKIDPGKVYWMLSNLTAFDVESPAGKVKITVGYKSTREPSSVVGAVWKGAVWAGEIEVNVPEGK